MYIIFNITGLKFDNVSNYQKGEQNYTCGEKNKSEYPSYDTVKFVSQI